MALGEVHAPVATRLDPEELADLLPDHISKQAELNEWEQSNIIQGQQWAFSLRTRTLANLICDQYVKQLHLKMFDETWKWAGCYRTSGKNIGIYWPEIPEQVRVACENAQHLVREKVYEPNELVVRFHHRLVVIHPFPNGNGRHARLMADMLLMKYFKLDRLTWGGGDLENAGENRDNYLVAMREGDNGIFDNLIEFATRVS